MDLEALFLNHFGIEKKPDIIQLIKAAIQVCVWKHPTKLKKHKDELVIMLLNPEKPGVVDVGDEESDSASDIEDDEEIESVGDHEKEEEEIVSGGVEFSVDDLRQTEKSSSSRFQEADQETGHIMFSVDDLRQTEKSSFSRFQETDDQETGHILGRNYKSTVLKVKLSLKKTRDIDDKVQHKHVDSDKEKKTEVGKYQSDNTESKNMSCITGSTTKKFPGGLRKMNEDISRVEEKQDYSPQIKRLEGGDQLQKQSNCSAITRPYQKTTQSSTVGRPMQKPAQSSTVGRPNQKTTQRSTVARPTQKPSQSSTVARPVQKVTQSSKVARPLMGKTAQSSTVARPLMGKTAQSSTVARPVQKVTQSSTVARPLMEKTRQSINNMKSSGMKFESSKRKFEERVAEQKNAKRRIIMVDFHDMPEPAKDPSAPKRCWDRRRRF